MLAEGNIVVAGAIGEATLGADVLIPDGNGCEGISGCGVSFSHNFLLPFLSFL